MNILDGKTIKGMKVADDKKALLFVTDKGDFIVYTEGDCCSETWIEAIELPAMGFPAIVRCVEDLEMQEGMQDDEYDYLQFYGCKITTDKGEIVIDYRNSSNGYYGGNLSWPGDDYYCGVYGQNTSTEIWVEIEEN